MNRVDEGMKVLEELATKDATGSAASTRIAVIDYSAEGRSRRQQGHRRGAAARSEERAGPADEGPVPAGGEEDRRGAREGARRPWRPTRDRFRRTYLRGTIHRARE